MQTQFKRSVRHRETEKPSHSKRRTLFVEGLPFHKTVDHEHKLLELCSKNRVHGALNLNQKNRYGFGYLHFRSSQEAKAAIQKLNGLHFCGRVLRVEIAKLRCQEESENLRRKYRITEAYLRQILLLHLPNGITQNIIVESLRESLPERLGRRIEEVKLLRHGKAFVTVQEKILESITKKGEDTEKEWNTSGQETVEEILEYVEKNRLKVKGHRIDVVRALPPMLTKGKVPDQERISDLFSTYEKKHHFKYLKTLERPTNEKRYNSYDWSERNPKNFRLHTHSAATQEFPFSKRHTEKYEHYSHLCEDDTSHTFLVGGLQPYSTPTEVKKLLFSLIGNVNLQCELILNQATKQHCGLARVSVWSSDLARKMLSLSGHRLDSGEVIEIEHDSSRVNSMHHQGSKKTNLTSGRGAISMYRGKG